MGYSMGSFVASITGAIDTRIRAAVLVGGGNLDGPGEYWDNAKPMCQGYPYQALAFLGDRAAVLYALHAGRGPTLIYNGLEDSVVNSPKTGPPFFADLRDRTVISVTASCRTRRSTWLTRRLRKSESKSTRSRKRWIASSVV
jgi:pimeloyl-ACP methyl ester carboxylesterase